MKILALSGSLRARSINSALLRATTRLAPNGMEISVFGGIGELPLFNPDLETHLPLNVIAFRTEICSADALVIASPEYAHGVSGVMKNALDWLVGCENFYGKPVAVFNATSRAHHADAALRETLVTMSAIIIEEASIGISMISSEMTEDDIVTSRILADQIVSSLNIVRDSVALLRSEQDYDTPSSQLMS